MDSTTSGQLTPMVLAAMETPGGAEKLKKWAEQTLAHHKNPLYLRAAEYWRKTQVAQIEKGAAKYLEPLNPASWTFDQLVAHAVQENVDQMHYLQALKEKSEETERRLRLLDAAEEALRRIMLVVDKLQPGESVGATVEAIRRYAEIYYGVSEREQME